ncbi:MAG: hypothetical protein ACLFNK_01835 [Candidatus Woesearchaeota archaeon]
MDFYKLDDGFSVVKLNPQLFSLDVAYSAAYTLLEKAYATFDGDPETEILVKLSFKDEKKNTEENLRELAKEFHNNLVNENANRLGSNKKEYIRALMLKKSFTEIDLEALDESAANDATNQEANQSGDATNPDEEVFTDEDFDDDLDDDFEFEDPEGIAVPWDEKFSDDETDSESSGEEADDKETESEKSTPGSDDVKTDVSGDDDSSEMTEDKKTDDTTGDVSKSSGD